MHGSVKLFSASSELKAQRVSFDLFSFFCQLSSLPAIPTTRALNVTSYSRATKTHPRPQTQHSLARANREGKPPHHAPRTQRPQSLRFTSHHRTLRLKEVRSFDLFSFCLSLIVNGRPHPKPTRRRTTHATHTALQLHRGSPLQVHTCSSLQVRAR